MKTEKQTKIIAFAASNSQRSINKQLLNFAIEQLANAEVEVIELSSFTTPIYSPAIEAQLGIPKSIQSLHRKFAEASAFLIASPEHNGLMPAFFKNIIDWLSRIDTQVFNSRPVALISTSPGARGGAGNLRILSDVMVWWGAQIMGTYSLPSFNQRFDQVNNTITDPNEIQKLQDLIHKLEAELHLNPIS